MFSRRDGKGTKMKKCYSSAISTILTSGLISFSALASALSLTSSQLNYNHRIIIVGKIIIDEYGQPSQRRSVSIGGGGPQAAFGAAVALAALSGSTSEPPEKQLVTFVGAVGEDWTEIDTQTLNEMLGVAVHSVELIKGSGLKTPRIHLWHDQNQNVEWKALNDSFGPAGAEALWNNRPSAKEMLSIIGKDEQVSCHVDLEGAKDSPGNGNDIQFLRDDEVQNRIAFLSAEPVAFPDKSGLLSKEDAESIITRLGSLAPALKLISPDEAICKSIEDTFWNNYEVAVRMGPKGSLICYEDTRKIIPAATLETADGEPVNPTGAGNAYSGALSALRSRGVPLEKAAILAAAIGAVFCEYDHIPPWTAAVIERVKRAAAELEPALQQF
mmetsp:Transcript_29419/g.44892  ORF Transcript_29419/g.44892 Transcript_29419/m.44892 type:complete len:385 (-) Transcript_29419:46-1200(-)